MGGLFSSPKPYIPPPPPPPAPLPAPTAADSLKAQQQTMLDLKQKYGSTQKARENLTGSRLGDTTATTTRKEQASAPAPTPVKSVLG